MSPPSSPLPVVAFSYDMIHEQIADAVEGPRNIFASWRPTLLLCISGGGLVPTRILRSCLRRVAQREDAAAGRDPSRTPNAAVQCVGLQLYDTEGLDPETDKPLRTQWIHHDAEAAARAAIAAWEAEQQQQHKQQQQQAAAATAATAAVTAAASDLSSPTAATAAARALAQGSSGMSSVPMLSLQGQRVLLVDEVDDSRATLAACCAELEADVARERAAYGRLRDAAVARILQAAVASSDSGGGGAEGAAPAPPVAVPPPWREVQMACFVVHNKKRAKRGVLPDSIIMTGRYFAAAYLPNCWVRYPWDAEDLAGHTSRARRQHAATRLLTPEAADATGAVLEQAAAGVRGRRRTDAQAPELVLPAA